MRSPIFAPLVTLAAFSMLATLGGCSSADLVVEGADDAPAASDANDAGTDTLDTTPIDDAPADTATSDSSPLLDTADAGTDAGHDDGLDGGIGDAGSDGISGDAVGAEVSDAIGLDAPSDVITADAVDAADVSEAATCDAPLHCYFDRDGDTFVASDGAVDACVCPTGSKTISATGTLFDCNDGDPSVHPGGGYHDGPYCVPGTACATKSFDYDCNGTEDKETLGGFGGCSSFGSGCGGAGWTASPAPACGASASYTMCSKATLSCTTSATIKVERCR